MWVSTTKASYKQPMSLPKPNFRATVSGRFTDFVGPVTVRPSTQDRSGYIQNSTLFDGTGWVPDLCLHGDLIRTEYRMRFNPPKPFHKLQTPVTAGKLPKKVNVYDVPKRK